MQIVRAAANKLAFLVKLEAEHGAFLTEAREVGLLFQYLHRAQEVGPHDADHGADGIGRRTFRVHAEGVQVDDPFAGDGAAAVGHLVIGLREIVELAEVVAQQINQRRALVGIADRYVAGCAHPKIDIGVEFGRPMDFDNNIAGLGRACFLLGFGGRIDERNHYHHQRHETGQRQEDYIAEDCSAVVVKPFHLRVSISL